MCDECPRVACKSHFPQIASVPMDLFGSLHFKCLSCEKLQSRGTKQDQRAGAVPPYRVRAIELIVQAMLTTPHVQGMYRKVNGNLEPFFDTFTRVEVAGHRPLHSRVDTSPIVIVNIRLESISDYGCAPRMLQAALQGYFVNDRRDNLVYIDAPYSIEYEESAALYRSVLTKRLEVLHRYV